MSSFHLDYDFLRGQLDCDVNIEQQGIIEVSCLCVKCAGILLIQ